jgi:hypothetical protein
VWNAAVIRSTTSTNFPTANALHSSYDSFVTKLNAVSAFVYSSYLSGSGDDLVLGVATDGSGNVYVTGRTDSTNFPTVAPMQANNRGGLDAFVTKLSATGSALYNI